MGAADCVGARSVLPRDLSAQRFRTRRLLAIANIPRRTLSDGQTVLGFVEPSVMGVDNSACEPDQPILGEDVLGISSSQPITVARRPWSTNWS
jgi:hypothetical protein